MFNYGSAKAPKILNFLKLVEKLMSN